MRKTASQVYNDRMDRVYENCKKANRERLRELWALACEHDGVSPDSKSAVFSDDNPHLAAYNEFYKGALL